MLIDSQINPPKYQSNRPQSTLIQLYIQNKTEYNSLCDSITRKFNYKQNFYEKVLVKARLILTVTVMLRGAKHDGQHASMQTKTFWDLLNCLPC